MMIMKQRGNSGTFESDKLDNTEAHEQLKRKSKYKKRFQNRIYCIS